MNKVKTCITLKHFVLSKPVSKAAPLKFEMKNKRDLEKIIHKISKKEKLISESVFFCYKLSHLGLNLQRHPIIRALHFLTNNDLCKKKKSCEFSLRNAC